MTPERQFHAPCQHGCTKTFCEQCYEESPLAAINQLGAELDAARAREAKLREAAQNYMSQFGQALEAHGLFCGPQQEVADNDLRAALAEGEDCGLHCPQYATVGERQLKAVEPTPEPPTETCGYCDGTGGVGALTCPVCEVKPTGAPAPCVWRETPNGLYVAACRDGARNYSDAEVGVWSHCHFCGQPLTIAREA